MKRIPLLSIGLLLVLVSVALAQTEIPLSKTSIEPGALEEEDIGAMCSLACAISWTVKASSHLAPQAGNVYDVTKLDDGLVRTANPAPENMYGPYSEALPPPSSLAKNNNVWRENLHPRDLGGGTVM